MSDSFLRRVFPNDVHHVAGFHDAIRSALPEHGRVLDLGCGDNRTLEPYCTTDREVWGVDFQDHPALARPQRFRLLGADGTIPFPDAHFDTVVALMVLEHVVAPRRFLLEAGRVMRPGGRLICHTISGEHYVTILRRLVGLLPHSWNQRLVKSLYGRDEVDTFPAFYRMNTEWRLRGYAARAGLSLVSVRRYVDPGYFRIFGMLESLAIVADRILNSIRPGWGRLYMTAVLEKPATVANARAAA